MYSRHKIQHTWMTKMAPKLLLFRANEWCWPPAIKFHVFQFTAKTNPWRFFFSLHGVYSSVIKWVGHIKDYGCVTISQPRHALSWRRLSIRLSRFLRKISSSISSWKPVKPCGCLRGAIHGWFGGGCVYLLPNSLWSAIHLSARNTRKTPTVSWLPWFGSTFTRKHNVLLTLLDSMKPALILPTRSPMPMPESAMV